MSEDKRTATIVRRKDGAVEVVIPVESFAEGVRLLEAINRIAEMEDR